MQNTEVYTRPKYAITSVDHALRLIQILRDTGGLRVSDAAAELDIAASTAHRLLAMLVYRGFAVQDDSRSYSPGPALGAAPSNVPWTRSLRTLCYPHLELLADRLNETVNLVFRVGGKVRFLASAEAPNILRVGDRTGTVLDARFASGGKAILAELDGGTLDRLYRSRSAELSGDFMADRDFARMLRELDQVRTQGYALNMGETESGVFALGIALHDQAGVALAALTVSAPAQRSALLQTDRVIALVTETRREIEAELRGVTLDPST
ncbi:DNA-binding IclR family transcriptional regulator [Okibacterium sp. HSC-33S16]|uniref:IclR family transcriptional regulator n=1 Tax=Okibacterium sp. HSC-33S16 TaxID=2910965 RepID=UPI00209EB94F|nr:IclR family transcriptional regulator [Okibacterium sp. HSC-33S16]MCP2032497.1 DNA-binding IclR family transcriptional regulator [Okibacterium sp. HSC-33S16]